MLNTCTNAVYCPPGAAGIFTRRGFPSTVGQLIRSELSRIAAALIDRTVPPIDLKPWMTGGTTSMPSTSSTSGIPVGTRMSHRGLNSASPWLRSSYAIRSASRHSGMVNTASTSAVTRWSMPAHSRRDTLTIPAGAIRRGRSGWP